MSNRPAFTLLELIVSIAVGGIIALLAYASASAGIDTREALTRYRSTSETALRARSLLADALRHASDESDAGAAAFQLLDASDARGLPTDQLTFLTRGIAPPLGASALWFVTIAPSARGLLVRATPATSTGEAPLSAILDGVRGLDVQVMSLADRSWATVWPSAGQLPAAVQLTFYDAAGALVDAPLVVRLGLESVR
jgi:prepilin-type N-terminal cleavage/methylation domain-containing protein